MIKRYKKIFFFLLCLSYFSTNTFSQNYDSYYKLNQVFEYMEDYYVDTLDMEKRIDDIIISTLKELDPHSIYISKEEVEKINEPLYGSFEGIGVYYNILEDTVVVISPISGGPSEKVGIKAGDRIVKVEGENIANIGVTNEIIREKLLGQKGTKVNVSIKRKGLEELIDFTITRDEIPIFSVDSYYMIDDEVGYIKLNRFSANSVDEFDEAYKILEKQGMKHLIFDLRDNGGGYLNTAIDISDEFLENEQLIVYTEGTNSEKKDYFASKKGHFDKGRLVILIDEGSASASEIVSGAVQDWDRGVLVGRRSFGKGLVQRPFNLVDGSVIRLTIARYYTPTGRLIQKPYEKGTDEYKKDIIKRYENGEFVNIDSIHFQDTLAFYTLNNKRVVYGGGGIMPDVFVPMDTTEIPEFYSNWVQSGLMYDFILKYSDENRVNFLSKYETAVDFDKGFKIEEEFYSQLIKFIDIDNSDTTNLSLSDIKNSDDLVEYRIKAQIARNLWSTNEYYQIINSYDNSFLKALEIINDKNLYETQLKN